MSASKMRTCCFSGHRHLPQENLKSIITRLNDAIDNLIKQGVTDFISGGALGFDQIAASLILAKQEMGLPVRLILALPCQNQDALWNAEQRRLYHYLLGAADDICYISEQYSDNCMKKRNRYMVDQSAYCICASSTPAAEPLRRPTMPEGRV